MKKFFALVLVLTIFTGSTVYSSAVYETYSVQNVAVSLELPFYASMYNIDSENIKVRYKELSNEKEKDLTKEQKKEYKKIKKIQKYITKNEFQKAFEEDSSFLPTYIQYFNYCLETNNLSDALHQLIKIQEINARDNILDKQKVSYKLGMLYYLNRNFPSALTYLTPFAEADIPNPSVDNLWFAMADIHYNLNNYSTSIYYAKKISRSSQNYLGALVILYNAYYSLNNIQEANRLALELVNLYPTAINYMRLGTTSKNVNTKLANYNKAREIAISNKNNFELAQADMRIAKIEQAKIDRAVKGLALFVEKPDWNKIYKEIEKIDDPVNISNRQVQFFNSTNACIAKFGDRELVKCFESVNKEQAKLTQELKIAYQKAYEEKQKQIEYQRQQMLLEQQRYYDRWYYNDFFYMRHPYFFGYW